uniref:Kinesin-like protein n=1 Tax=Esox lucius TaxID=8010 RepID=A0A3P8ZSP3_ESOLU
MSTQAGSEVKVFLRTRPTANFAENLIEYVDGQTVNVHQKKDSRKGVVNNQLNSWSFRLDGVLHDVSQEEVYARVGRGVVLGAVEGYNGTVMCFGQTGAGKTYTITGASGSYQERGIIPRAIQEVFHEVDQRSTHTFRVQLSYLEIYNESLVDLLASLRGCPGAGPGPGGMAVVEEACGGVSIRGLSLHLVHSEEEALNLLFEGEMNRIIGTHALNKNSSRSHCIFTVHIESHSRTLSEAKYVTSKLNLVDLAGSERLGKIEPEGQMLKEAMYINKSLSFLEQAILALADRRRDHIPFRQSKLTHALKDSLGGNCNTVLVANIYGEAAHVEETLSTLRFASRMKRVQTDPIINQHTDPVVRLLLLYANRMETSYETLSEAQVAEVQSQVQRFLEGSLDEINVRTHNLSYKEHCQFVNVLNRLQEQKVKAQLCQNYTLVEKDQSTADSSAAKVSLLEGSSSASDCLPSSSPPPKADAFEDFKAEQGSEINRILKENKVVLLECRARLRELTEGVNTTKREIDSTSTTLRQWKDRQQSQGQFISADGVPVLDEAELSLVLRLRDLKTHYRQQYEELHCIKAEVNYCQHLVDQCRTRLLTEFESWYNESFLLPEEVQALLRSGGTIRPGLVPVDKALSLVSYKHSIRFPPSATIFYSAHNRTVKRVGQHTHICTPISPNIMTTDR